MAIVANRRVSRRRAGGYQKTWPLLNRIFDSCLASAMLLAASPLMIFIAIMIKAQDGGPVFYRGRRFGINKTFFEMYKFRTLSVNAEALIGGDLLGPQHNVITPVGKFFRDTRIDEIPQLLNVIFGDMDFVGPRPERPEVYEKQCKTIPGYEKRFEVKPGLIGYSQLFTPHSAPKRIRTLIDNIHLERKQYPLEVTALIIWAFSVMLQNLLFKSLHEAWSKVISRGRAFSLFEKRMLERVRPKGVRVFISSSKGEIKEGLMGDMNDLCVLVYADNDLHVDEKIRLKMQVSLWKFQKQKRKTVHATAEVQSRRELDGMKFKYAYVFRYTPDSPLNKYFFDQYFLKKSII